MGIMTGTIVNVLAVVICGFIGTMLHFAAQKAGTHRANGASHPRLQAMSHTIMHGLALCVIMIGINGIVNGVFSNTADDGTLVFTNTNTLITIISMTVGIILGEALDLDGKMKRLGDWIELKMNHGSVSEPGKTSISEGFVTASLLFCVGAMAIVGSLKSGLENDHSVLYTKSMLDGISSFIFASSLGAGVMISGAAVLVYQGTITLLASVLSPLLTTTVIAEMNCVGSLLIVGLGLNMLGVTRIKVMNGVPAIILPIILCLFM